MSEIYHSHITIECTAEEAHAAAKMVKGKATVIHLENKYKSQQDIMITNYYVVGKKGLTTSYDVYNRLIEHEKTLADAGYSVLRSKLEKDILGKFSKTAYDQYYEIHMKYMLSLEELPSFKELAYNRGWHPSTNPYQQNEDGTVVQFVNKRFTDIDAIEPDIDETLSVLNVAELRDVKRETVVYDSNVEHDKWWL